MRKEDALSHFIEIVSNDENHMYKQRTLDVAKFAYSTTTGDDLSDLITSVRKRETPEQKKQRVEVTKALTPVSVEMIKKYFRKLRKTDGLKKENKWTEENRTATENLNSNLIDFYARQSAESYLFDILEDYTFLDPNAFLVIERMNITDDQGRIIGVRSYPIVFESDKIRHYDYSTGVLSSVLIEEAREEKGKHNRKAILSEFRMYGAGWTLHAVEYVEDKPTLKGTNSAYSDLSIDIIGSRKTKSFVFYLYDTGTNEVPAIRLGAYLDGRTKAQTAVTPMEPVGPLLESLINVGSLHDLTVFLHSISRRRELVETCDYFDETTAQSCEGGQISNGITCPRCKGTGDKSISSEQDMIRITLPPNFTPDDIPDLAKMAHVEQADVALLQWQQEKIDWLLKFIVYATMTRDAVTMAEVSRTATEMNLNNQEAYDKLQPYAELYSQAYMLISRITTQYQDSNIGFISVHHFPDDFQFETEKELLLKLREARDTQAPYEYVTRLNLQLIRRQTRSVEEAERAKAWETWKPWPDMSEEMLTLVLADRAPQDHDRILRENFFKIRIEIEQETNGMFFRMPYEAQKTLIDNKVDELIGSIQFRSEQEIEFEI